MSEGDPKAMKKFQELGAAYESIKSGKARFVHVFRLARQGNTLSLVFADCTSWERAQVNAKSTCFVPQ